MSEKPLPKQIQSRIAPYKPLRAELKDLKLTDELDPEEEVDLEEAAKYHNEDGLPNAPSAPSMAFILVPDQKDKKTKAKVK